jgi:hypothetical protein
LRIPFPLITSLQDYKTAVELYNLYYGEQWFKWDWKYTYKGR